MASRRPDHLLRQVVEIQIEDPRTEPLVITPDHVTADRLCEKFAIDLQDYGIAA